MAKLPKGVSARAKAPAAPAPTPEELREKEIRTLRITCSIAQRAEERFLENLEDTVEHAEAKLAEFKARLDSDPAYAFEWGEDAMKAAAKVTLFRGMVASLREKRDPPMPIRVALGHLQRQGLEKIRFAATYGTGGSSSTASNMMAGYKVMAWAALLETVETRLETIKDGDEAAAKLLALTGQTPEQLDKIEADVKAALEGAKRPCGCPTTPPNAVRDRVKIEDFGGAVRTCGYCGETARIIGPSTSDFGPALAPHDMPSTGEPCPNPRAEIE